MFKDVVAGFLHPAIRAVLNLGDFHRVQCGIYDDCGYNFSNLIDMQGWEEFVDHAGVPSYGVADSIEQFIDLYGSSIVLDSRGCAVGFTTVRKSEMPESGGWRWHKWGGYVGKQEPTCEYLYDEPKIEEVTTFTVLWEKTK